MSKGKSKIKQEEEHERTYTLPHPNQTPSQTHQPKKPNTNTPHSYKNIYQKKNHQSSPLPPNSQVRSGGGIPNHRAYNLTTSATTISPARFGKTT